MFAMASMMCSCRLLRVNVDVNGKYRAMGETLEETERRSIEAGD